MRSTFLHIPLVILKKVTRVLAACALTACMGVANASSTYDFYWCDLASGNEVFGYITGLQDIDGPQAATSVVTLSNDVSINEIDYLGLDCGPGSLYWCNNSFEVIAGVIRYAQFMVPHNKFLNGRSQYHQLTLQYGGARGDFGEYYLHNRNCFGNNCRYVIRGALQMARRIETVAEPGSVILLSLGLVGLAFSRYRKQS
jgi:hypothetical protein